MYSVILERSVLVRDAPVLSARRHGAPRASILPQLLLALSNANRPRYIKFKPTGFFNCSIFFETSDHNAATLYKLSAGLTLIFDVIHVDDSRLTGSVSKIHRCVQPTVVDAAPEHSSNVTFTIGMSTERGFRSVMVVTCAVVGEPVEMLTSVSF